MKTNTCSLRSASYATSAGIGASSDGTNGARLMLPPKIRRNRPIHPHRRVAVDERVVAALDRDIKLFGYDRQSVRTAA